MNNNTTQVLMMAMVALIILGCVGAGAWLVITGHPWFSLIPFALAASARYSSKS